MMAIKWYFYALLVCVNLLTLPACTVGHDFVRPTNQINTQYTEKPIQRIGSQRLTHMQPNHAAWWTDFGSQTLNKIMIEGITHNHALLSMQHRLKEARALLTAKQGAQWPQISLGMDAGKQLYGVALFGPSDFFIPPYSYYEIGPSTNYLLDLFGKTKHTIEKEAAHVCYQQQALNATFLTMTGNIASTALSIATINAEIKTIEEMIKDDKQTLALAETAERAGGETTMAVLTAKHQLIEDQTLLPSRYQALQTVQHALSVLLGRASLNTSRLNFEVNGFSLPTTLPLIIPSELIHQRPDILGAEALLRAANAEVGIATANLYPAITLSANTLQEALGLNQLFNGSANAWSLLGTISTPIFSGGTLRATRQASQEAYQAVYHHYQDVVLKAFSEIRDVLGALQQDANTIQLREKDLLNNQKNWKLAQFDFEAGHNSRLFVLAKKRLYLQSKLAHINARAKQYQDNVQLHILLGDGLETQGLATLPETKHQAPVDTH